MQIEMQLSLIYSYRNKKRLMTCDKIQLMRVFRFDNNELNAGDIKSVVNLESFI